MPVKLEFVTHKNPYLRKLPTSYPFHNNLIIKFPNRRAFASQFMPQIPPLSQSSRLWQITISQPTQYLKIYSSSRLRESISATNSSASAIAPLVPNNNFPTYPMPQNLGVFAPLRVKSQNNSFAS
jgi:hypothetical protein